MFEEIKIAFFKHKDVTGPWWPSNFLEVLNRGNKLVESQFGGRIKLGRIEEGYKADIVLLDYNTSENVMDEIKAVVRHEVHKCEEQGIRDWSTIKNCIRENLREYIFSKTKRNPMIIPIVMEI